MSSNSTIEHELRQRLETMTADVRAEADLGTTIARGRRRRSLRHAGIAASSAAAVAVAGAAVLSLGIPGRAPVATGPAPAAGGASSVDWVGGSTVDEAMALVVAERVAHPGATTDIHPGDWTRATALPDAEAGRATDWQAQFRVDAHEDLTLFMSQRPADAPAGPKVCTPSRREVDGNGTQVTADDLGPNGSVQVTVGGSGAAACVARQTPSGTLVLTRDGARTTATLWRTADDTVVTATSVVDDPGAGRRVTDAELEAVATDPRLAFEHVTDPPAWPASNGPGWPAGL